MDAARRTALPRGCWALLTALLLGSFAASAPAAPPQRPAGPATTAEPDDASAAAAAASPAAATEDVAASPVSERATTPAWAVLTLLPPSAEVEVASEHCVTATLTDGLGAALPGAAISLRVTGTQSRSAELTTDAAGEARYCYNAADLVGEDAIEASASVGARAQASAALEVRPPASSAGCKLEYLGQALTSAGLPTRFSGFALDAHGNARGAQAYRDFTFRSGVRVDSLRTEALRCSKREAAIFGRAKARGGPGWIAFRVDLEDGGATPELDRYRIRLANGYDSGSQPLRSGYVEIAVP